MAYYNLMTAAEQVKFAKERSAEFLPTQLKALTGSPKQVSWAEKERAKILQALAERLAMETLSAADTSDMNSMKQAVRREEIRQRTEAAVRFAAEIESAKLWIDLLRTQGIDTLIKLLGTEEGRTKLASYR